MTSSESQPRTLIADGLLNGRDPEIAKAIMEPNGKQYRKTALVWAFPLSEEVTVNTPEGHMQAHIGDYLVSDKSLTHLWPVRRDVFEATHVEAEAADTASAQPGSLDVERLAKALDVLSDDGLEYDLMSPEERADRADAASELIAEYARLAEKPHD